MLLVAKKPRKLYFFANTWLLNTQRQQHRIERICIRSTFQSQPSGPIIVMGTQLIIIRDDKRSAKVS